jgi:hypothetical protein
MILVNVEVFNGWRLRLRAEDLRFLSSLSEGVCCEVRQAFAYAQQGTHFLLFRLRHPSWTASSSEIGFMLRPSPSMLISTKQGMPISKGNAVSSLTFVGM